MAILLKMAKDPISWLQGMETIEISPKAFDKDSPRYELNDESSILNVKNPNCIFNRDELFYVWGGYELFWYIRHLKDVDSKYDIGNSDLYWDSAVEMRCIYCNKARFFFFATGWGDDYYVRRKKILDEENLDECPTIGEVRYIDLTMVKPYFNYYAKLIRSGKLDKVGFDFETSGFPSDENFEITGFSLATQQLSTWFDFRYPLDVRDEVKIEAYEAFKEFLDEFDVYLWTYNVSFETFVCARLFNKRYEFQDARALFVCDGTTRGSLKLNSMKLLNIRGWVENKDAFIGQSYGIFERFKSYDELMNFKSDGSDFQNDTQNLIDNLNKLGADWNLFKKFWGSVWGVIPTKTLGYYCCLDSFYTLKDADKLLPKYVRSYRTYLNNARLVAELEFTGIRINTETLRKTEENMLHLQNMGNIFLDQFVLLHKVTRASRISKGFEFSSRFIRGMERHGMTLLSNDIGKWVIKSYSNGDVIVYNEEATDRLFDGNEEFINRMKDAFSPYTGWLKDKGVTRRRKFIEQVTWIIKDYHEVYKNIEKFNRDYNFNDNFIKIKNYLNSYVENTKTAVFGNLVSKINWDKYRDFYCKCVDCNNMDIEFLEQCKEFVNCESRYEIKELVDLIRNNKDAVDFFQRPYIKDEEWTCKDNFLDCLSDAIKVEDSKKFEFSKLFGNFYSEADLLCNKLELDKYDSMEPIVITDKPEYVTFGSEKVYFKTFGGRQANYNSPDTKKWLADIIYDDYAGDCRFDEVHGEKWHELIYKESDPDDYYKDFPIQDPENGVEYDENGKLIKVKLNLDYETHMNYYNTIPCYKEWIYRGMMWTDAPKEYLQRYAIHNVYSYGKFDSGNLRVNLNFYKTSMDRLLALLFFYNIWSGMFKEYSGYIHGPKQGIYTRWRNVLEKRDFYEIRTDDDSKALYKAYYPDWHPHKADTKRWASGFHTFVPHSDTMAIFEVCKDEGEEEVAIYFDINAAELRSIAYTTEDEVACGIFNAGKDFYLEVVKTAYPNESPDFWKVQRRRWKPCVLGIFYGIGNRAIANAYGISIEDAEFIRQTLMGRLDKIKADIQESVDYCRKNGEILTVLGDRMYAESWRAATVGYNSKIQGFSAVALADAFENDVVCLNASKCPTNIKVVVHDSNTLTTKVKNLFSTILGIDKFYKEYFIETYKLRYKYDLVLHVNYRDSIDFSFDPETLEVTLKCTGYGCDWLYGVIKKYYKIEVIEESVTPDDWDPFSKLILQWGWKSHRYYCDSDFKLPATYYYKFRLLTTKEELTKNIDIVKDYGTFYKDRDMKSHLARIWSKV